MIHKLLKFLSAIGHHGTLVMPVGVVLGLLFPSLTELSRPLAEPLVIFMLAVSIFCLNPATIIKRVQRSLMILVAVVWIILVTPFLIFFIGSISAVPIGLLVVLTAWSCSPPLVSIPGLAIILNLDGPTALLTMIGSTCLFSFSLPIILLFLLGDNLGLDPSSISLQLLGMVSICCIIGQGSRWLIGNQRVESHAKSVDGIIVLAMLLFAITIMGGFHQALETAPHKIPIFLAAAVLASIGSQLFSAVVFLRFEKRVAGAIALSTGNRNTALLLPVASGTFAQDLWLYLAVVQIPIYFLPMITKPLYRKYCKTEHRIKN